MNPTDLLLPISLLALLVQTALGLDCYVCNSGKDKSCESLDDGKSADFLKTCPPDAKPTSCMKQETQTYVRDRDEGRDVNGPSVVTRFCGTEIWSGCYTKDGAKSTTMQCSCLDNKCNSGPALYSSSACLLIGLAALLHRLFL